MADQVKVLTTFPTPPVAVTTPVIPTVASFFDAYLKKEDLPSTTTITGINSRLSSLEGVVDTTDTSSLVNQITNVENIVNTKVLQLEKDTCDNAKKIETIKNAVLWTPSRMQTSAWFDADDESKLTTDQGKLSVWYDSNIPENSLRQEDPNKRPSYTHGCISDNEVKFSGSIITSDVQKEVTTDSSGDYLLVALLQSENSSDAELFRAEISSDDYLTRVSMDNGLLKAETKGSDSLSTALGSEYNVISLLQSSSALSSYINGEAISAFDVQSQSVGALTKFYMGSGTFNIKELVFLSWATCTGDRQTLEGYIAHKWGYESKLFNNHPFKIGAPVIYNNQVTCGYGFGI